MSIKPVIRVMVDSGAFSAFTQKKAIDRTAYAEFLLKNAPHLEKGISLDMINPDDPNVAAAAGWENFMWLRDKGLDVMPVYHARESLNWLDKMMALTDYIGLSGTSLVSPSEHINWYNIVWNYITDPQGRPVIRTHAFGDTAHFSMQTYPWHSADSATWHHKAGRASVVSIDEKVFKLRAKYRTNNMFVSMDDAPAKKDVWEKEFTRRGLNVEKFMSSTKLTLTDIQAIRAYLNATYMFDLEKTYNSEVFKSPNTLMDTKKFTDGKARTEPVRLYFTFTDSVYRWSLPIMARLGVKHCLISYFYISSKKWEDTIIPFLYEPEKTCRESKGTDYYWNLLEEYTFPRTETAVPA